MGLSIADMMAPRGDVSMMVEELKHKYLNIWYDTKTSFPLLEKRYNFIEKTRKERELNRFIESLANLLNNMPEGQIDQDIWRTSITNLVRNFGCKTLEFDETLLDIIFTDGYAEVTNLFIKEARNFDSEINIFDIFQAIRNVWIMNSIQIFLGMDVEFSLSIFAYSMLYPYSDNYIDNPNLRIDGKRDFSERFEKRLLGEIVIADNSIEECIFKLVGMIESQYPRQTYPQVYEALISIHNAQEKSLLQQKGRTSPYEKDIAGISFEKGGTSVLADGFLINPMLRREQEDFMFGYGVFLQLADDLQDINEDYQNGHMTIFSQLANRWPLDVLTNRLFHFIYSILYSDNHFTTQSLKDLKKLIEISCNFLIFEAIAKNKNLYSRKYINEIQQHCMFRFSYIKRFKKKLMRKFSKIDLNSIISALYTRDQMI
jgi:hypothetical protein